MPTLSSKTIAERFIRDQFAIMEKHGGAPKLSAERYKKLLSTTRRSFEALKPPDSETEHQKPKKGHKAP
jgi:hypothetical protein